jgi:hypothetical protein
MKQVCLFALALNPFNWIAAQEVHHAPTVEQCRADQKLWGSRLLVPNHAGVAHVSYDELEGWIVQMITCHVVGPAFQRRYDDTNSEIASEQKSRLLNFIFRHNLLGQFIAEDAQGKR